MINTESYFNMIKIQIFCGNDPISDDRWQDLGLDDTTDVKKGSEAIGMIRHVLKIFDYMDHPQMHMAWISSANGVRHA